MGTVLVVDDQPALQRSLSRLLQRMGITALVASDGEAAVAMVRDRPDVSLVLMDVYMPGMGGYAAARRLRELRPSMPMVLMSGSTDGDVPEDLARDDRIIVLEKPFDRELLSATLDKLVKGS